MFHFALLCPTLSSPCVSRSTLLFSSLCSLTWENHLHRLHEQVPCLLAADEGGSMVSPGRGRAGRLGYLIVAQLQHWENSCRVSPEGQVIPLQDSLLYRVLPFQFLGATTYVPCPRLRYYFLWFPNTQPYLSK